MAALNASLVGLAPVLVGVLVLLALGALRFFRWRVRLRGVAAIEATFRARGRTVLQVMPVTQPGGGQWWRERGHPGGPLRYEVLFADGEQVHYLADVRTGNHRGVVVESTAPAPECVQRPGRPR